MIEKHPNKVIAELRFQFERNAQVKETPTKREYIPGSHHSSTTYKDLKKERPDLAIPFFIEVIVNLAKRNKIRMNIHDFLNFVDYAVVEVEIASLV